MGVVAMLAIAAPARCLAQPDSDVRCRSEDGVLPAGVYWVFVGWYEQSLDCPRPGVALVDLLKKK